MALSTYLHDPEHVVDEHLTRQNAGMPIFMAHGLMDPMIPITRAITSREALRAWTTRSSGTSTRWVIRCASKRSTTSVAG